MAILPKSLRIWCGLAPWPNQQGGRVLPILLLMLVVFALAAGYWVMQDFRAFLTQPLQFDTPKGMLYSVKKGDSVQRIAHNLARQGVLQKPRYLILYARLEGLATRIKTGEYWIPAKATPAKFLQVLVAGRTVQYSLTLIEGWDFKQVMQAVHTHPNLQHTLALTLSPSLVMKRLGYPGIHPEGRFFPDTYHFPQGTSDIEFLQRAYVTMQKKLASIWQTRVSGLPLEGPGQALILASIVEKETGQATERSHIAGVFIRRLRKGMRLQSDPTVIYGKGEDFDGNLRKTDLRQDTPYNTYVHGGLPPTPIALPGAGALRAVVQPLETKDVYFVARGDGYHHFSVTLKEHNRMVWRYQKSLRSSGK